MKWDWVDINTIEFNQDRIIRTDTGEQFNRNEYISKDRENKTEKMHNDLDKKRSLCAGFLANRMLKKEYPDMITPVRIQYGKLNGKPFLADYQDTFFNLSHAGDYVVCVIHNKEIGIDIEKLTRMRERVAERFFSRTEREELTGYQNADEKQKRLLLYWILKESYIKATGMGLKTPLDSFSVRIADKENGQRVTFEQNEKQLDYEATVIEFNSQYSIAICNKK